MRKNKIIRIAALALCLGASTGFFLVTRAERAQESADSTARFENAAGDTIGEQKPEAAMNGHERLQSDLPRGPIAPSTTIRTATGMTPRTPMVPSTIREAASVFRHGQNNAFFDEAAYMRTFAANGGQGIENLRKELQRTEVLAALPENVDFFKDAPEEVLDRMAMIDMLGTLAKDDTKALDTLVEIASSPIDTTLPPHVIKALVGEKYDAFVELARHDWKVASSAFSALDNDKLKEAMRPALIGGLVDSGTPNDEALRMVQAI